MAQSKKYISIKGRFKSENKKIYGIFYFIINQENDAIDTASVIVSLYATVYETDIEANLVDFDRTIQSIKSEGQYALVTTKDLQNALKSIASDYKFYREIEPYINSQDEERLSPILQSFFGGILEDKKINLKIKIQAITEEEINLDSLDTPFDEGKKDNEIGTEQDTSLELMDVRENALTAGQTILEVNLVLAPVGGKPVNHLKISDRVMVRILPNTEVSKHYIDQLNPRDKESHASPIAGEIISIKKDDNEYEIIVQIADRICGKIHEKEKILVKMAVSPEAGMKPPAQTSFKEIPSPKMKQGKKEKKSSILLFVGIGFLGIMLIFILILLTASL